MVLSVAIGALDIITDKVPASNDLSKEEEGVSLSSDQTGLQVLILGDVLPCAGGAGRLQELEGSLLGSLELGAGGRSHTLANVDLLGNLTSDLGVVEDRAYRGTRSKKKCVLSESESGTNKRPRFALLLVLSWSLPSRSFVSGASWVVPWVEGKEQGKQASGLAWFGLL